MNTTKKIVRIAQHFFLFLCIIYPFSISADDNATYNISMQKETNNTSWPNIQGDPEGRRIPPKPINCTISPDGIYVSGLSEDIITYEIWNDAAEICIASFTEESEFLEFLFSQSGEFHISFITENYCISGNILL